MNIRVSLAMPCGMCDLSSQTRDEIGALDSGSVESSATELLGSPKSIRYEQFYHFKV